MGQFIVNPIGKVKSCEEGMFIEVEEKYIPGLKELGGFSHVNVIWWCDQCDDEAARSILEVPAPYKKAPGIMGIFATRSPVRPNPIALTAVEIIYIDEGKGLIQVAYIDANDGTPVLDLKPYTPSFDRVKEPGVPQWCSHWPASLEESGDFDWENEFTF